LLNFRGICLAQIARVTTQPPVPIAIVMSSFDPGGTEHQMIELIRRLDKRRWNIHVASLRHGGQWFDRVTSAVPCATFPLRSFRSPSTIVQLRAFVDWCREKRFAIVHAADMPSNTFGVAGAALAGVPVRIASRRDVNRGWTAAQLALQRASYALAHVIAANSKAAAARLRVEHVSPRKIAVIPNGLELARFRVRSSHAPLRRVVTVANLRPEKGHAVLIRAAVRILDEFPDARFVFVGNGTERDALVELARACGVSHAVSFAGHSEDVASYLAAADLFALPSRTEAFPNALLEAMAAGLPVVASAVGGIPEIVDDGQTGLLAAAGDPRALADRIARLMRDGQLAARLGTAARMVVAARFSFERMVSDFDRLYVSQLTRRGLAPVPQMQLAVS